MIRQLFLVAFVTVSGSIAAAAGERPNVVVILADDLGYGDVQCYNPTRGKIKTPRIDRLAAEGMRFTDAHTSSGVCSPTRYGLLTGRYHWRSRLQAGIVGYLERPLIAPERMTLGTLFQKHGYRTAAIGKWHLGWDWNIPEGQRPLFAPGKDSTPEVTAKHLAAWNEVYGRPIGGGPTARGFDSYFGTDVPNWPPYAFLRDDRLTKIPDTFLPTSLLKNHQASTAGPAVDGWKLESVLPALEKAACGYIRKSVQEGKPFFLYLPLTAPHTPLAVNDEWKGKSGLGAYADLVMETDAMVGRVLDALEDSGAAKNTLVLFTSDNGCAPYIGAKDMEAQGHYPSGPLRGYKADAWEGGHRVPFLVRWPGEVKAGTTCAALVHQVDVFATLAEVLQFERPQAAGEDSVSLLSLLRGSDQPTREYAVSCASSGLPALRQGSWKILFGAAGGGFGKQAERGAGQLYDLANDLGETKNLWDEKPELVAELTAAMERIVAAHPNDVPVRWRRFLK